MSKSHTKYLKTGKRYDKLTDLIKKATQSLFLIIPLCFFAYFIFVAFSGSDSNSDVEAWVLAKHSVENRLKSPSSAKFPPMNKADISEIDGTVVVKSYVEAENSFGVSKRTNFTVVMTKKTDGNYSLESVSINE